MAQVFPTIASGAPRKPAKMSTSADQLVVAGETIAVTAAQLTLGAALGNILIPKNAEILWVMLDSTDIDTNGSPAVTLSIGDAASNARLLAANTIGQAGAITVGPTIAKTGFGYQPTAETLMQVYVAVAPATAAAGTIKYAIAYCSQ